ncbi:MAG: endonuclease III [Oligosphaeraceae bacterium]|nr:endonuclease III [Oligosphaeraceae bacterium]
MTAAEVESLFAKLARARDPKPELSYRTPLDLLVAVVLSAQTTDKAVNKVTAELWKHCRTAQDYLAWGQERLEESCRSIGLFRNKSRAIIGLCQSLLENHHGLVPPEREALMRLPGVGRKTANVVLNVAFGQPTLAVDTHVFRVANRTGLAAANTPEETEEQLLAVIPAQYLRHAHHYLLLHGRYCCTARKPDCENCPIRQECRSAPGKNCRP